MRRDSTPLALMFRFRIVLLGALAAITLAAMAALAVQSGAQDMLSILPLFVVIVPAFIIALLHVRHLFLAITVVIAPLPGLVWAGIMAVPGPQTLVLVYAFAITLSFFLAAIVANGVAQGEAPETISERSVAMVAAPAAMTVGIIVSVMLLRFLFEEGTVIVGLQLAFAAVSTVIVTPLSASGLSYSEVFLERFNRCREARGRVMESMAMVALPRWSASFAGIALVFTILGGFGAADFIRQSELLSRPALLIGSTAILFLGGYAIAGGWRNAAALSAAFLMVFLCGLWALVETGINPGSSEFLGLVVSTGGGLLSALTLMARAENFRLTGDETTVARLRAIEENGIAIFYAGLAGLTSFLTLAFSRSEWPALIIIMVMGALSAGIFAPALATLIETAFPRRRSLEEVFGKR